MRLAVAAMLVVASTALGHAGTKRVAIVVGNNVGNEDQVPLHFAEADATKFAGVLTELGGVAPDDLFLLEGKNLGALTDAFARVQRRIKSFRADPSNRIIVMFYFSGHSDGEALELGRDRLAYAELRRWLAAAGADVRVALVDSCKSGALLAAKGGHPGEPFQIRLTDDLASTGEALLTSSAADEVALESREIGGSFFTHHFISGLRGAADTSGDGIVTLSEAYQYAYEHTIKTTGETIIGPQHPAYDYRLSGQGELVLAELGRRTAALDLPKGFDRVLVVDAVRAQVVAEVASDAHGAIAVRPGTYEIRAWRRGAISKATVHVAASERRAVDPSELTASTAPSTTSKGGLAVPMPPPSLFVAAGMESGITDGLGVVPGMRAELVLSSGLSFAAVAGSRYGVGVRETSTLLLAGYRRTITRGDVSAWAGVEAGAGAVIQSDVHPSAFSATIAIGAIAGASVALSPRVSAEVEGSLPAALMRRDGNATILALPALWLGIAVKL